MTTTLHYFDFDGSRGLECRLALTLAGVAFEDIRVRRPDWADLKATMPFGAMPVLTEDGRALSQSNAILGYVGRRYGLHPTDAWAAAEHEAVLESVEDLRNKLPSSGSDEEKKAAREAFGRGWLKQWADTVTERVRGPFLEGDAIGVADIKLYVILRAFRSGTYDHLPASYFDAYPKLLALYDAVEKHPKVAAYFART